MNTKRRARNAGAKGEEQTLTHTHTHTHCSSSSKRRQQIAFGTSLRRIYLKNIAYSGIVFVVVAQVGCCASKNNNNYTFLSPYSRSFSLCFFAA